MSKPCMVQLLLRKLSQFGSELIRGVLHNFDVANGNDGTMQRNEDPQQLGLVCLRLLAISSLTLEA